MSAARALGLLAGTAVVVAALGAFDPFDAVSRWLLGSDETVRRQPVRQDPASWDLSFGEDLERSLSTRPLPPAGARRILVLGDSQQYTCSLPRGGRVANDHRAVLASDHLAARLASRESRPVSIYNASAPRQTLAEALWQGVYWLKVAPDRPEVVIVQSNFDRYRHAGIRAGFQTLLGDAAFTAALNALTTQGERPYTEQVVGAIRAYSWRRAELGGGRGVSPEAALRRGLEGLPLYRLRGERRATLENALFHLRIRAFGLRPAGRRHVLGPPLAQNLAALEDLVRLARTSGARVLVYNAPLNPAVPLFYDDEYREYLDRLRRLARSESATFADLADALPPERWGYWIDAPDAVHFDEAGHQILAERFEEALGPALRGP